MFTATWQHPCKLLAVTTDQSRAKARFTLRQLEEKQTSVICKQNSTAKRIHSELTGYEVTIWLLWGWCRGSGLWLSRLGTKYGIFANICECAQLFHIIGCNEMFTSKSNYWLFKLWPTEYDNNKVVPPNSQCFFSNLWIYRFKTCLCINTILSGKVIMLTEQLAFYGVHNYSLSPSYQM